MDDSGSCKRCRVEYIAADDIFWQESIIPTINCYCHAHIAPTPSTPSTTATSATIIFSHYFNDVYQCFTILPLWCSKESPYHAVPWHPSAAPRQNFHQAEGKPPFYHEGLWMEPIKRIRWTFVDEIQIFNDYAKVSKHLAHAPSCPQAERPAEPICCKGACNATILEKLNEKYSRTVKLHWYTVHQMMSF